MLSFVRTLLIWLLALAVPAQAVAAATMAFCGPGHQGRVVQPGSTSNGRHHHDATKAEHSHVQHPVLHGEGLASPGGEHSASTDRMHADSHKCSACASCCSALALASVIEMPACPEFAATRFDCVAPSVEKFSAEGPDRPPRIRFA
ncbi:MAG: hypothetical protein JHC40_01645 [Burkholderiales bacterium]|jgi:hypothetical protein|nr:hypothetical protein [Burkholderiales bacterium]